MEQISYLIASYNKAPYVGDCLDSLAAQTDGNWCCLICDDASTDGSPVRIREHLARLDCGDRIRYLENAENRGYIATLRRLISAARTDIVGILDADDALLPEATATVLQVYAADPQIEFTASKAACINVITDSNMGVSGHPPPPGRSSLTDGWYMALRTFRRRAYDRTDGYSDECPYAEDRELVLRLEEVTHPVFIDRVLYRYHCWIPGSQAHDPVKRRVGQRHIYTACRAAVVRRQLRGISKYFALLLAYLNSHQRDTRVRGVSWLYRNLARIGARFPLIRGEYLPRGPRPIHVPDFCVLDSVQFSTPHGSVETEPAVDSR